MKKLGSFLAGSAWPVVMPRKSNRSRLCYVRNDLALLSVSSYKRAFIVGTYVKKRVMRDCERMHPVVSSLGTGGNSIKGVGRVEGARMEVKWWQAGH